MLNPNSATFDLDINSKVSVLFKSGDEIITLNHKVSSIETYSDIDGRYTIQFKDKVTKNNLVIVYDEDDLAHNRKAIYFLQFDQSRKTFRIRNENVEII